MKLSIYPVTLGCPKNRIDTEVGLWSISKICDSFTISESLDKSNLIFINTCAFIQKSVEESIETVLEIASEKSNEQILVVTGCLVERYGKELIKELPEVDLFSGVSDYEILGEKILKKINLFKHITEDQKIGRILTTPFWRSYVKISEGCSNRCAYCLIPTLRGRQVCRSPMSIIKEINDLVKSEVKEITLVAQDLTSYSYKGVTLSKLLKSIIDSTDVEWLRLLYMYPSRISDDLLDVINSNKRICSYFDIPIQHASDTILSKMNRRYNLNDLENIIERIRESVHDSFLRTTVITGFPGENDFDFECLLDFVQRAEFDHLGCFTYSDEEGCEAFNFSNKVIKKVAEERLNKIMTLQQKISKKKNRSIIGKKHDVLVEGLSKETDLLLEGRTKFQAHEIDGVTYINEGKATPGSIVTVEIVDSHVYDLVGKIV